MLYNRKYKEYYTLVKEMIGFATKAGIGAVKFQTLIPEKLVTHLDQAGIL